MDNFVNLVKLCVGIDSVEHLQAVRAARQAANGSGESSHVTRMWPKRADEVLNGGSLYWVIKGVIQARQRILRLDEVIGQDGIRRCAIILDDDLIRTQPARRRPFQGWRYFDPDAAPADLTQARATDSDLPPELRAALAEIGIR